MRQHAVNDPKRLGFVATNDATGEIVYLSFWNDDVDYIKNLPEFILENCGWRHIR